MAQKRALLELTEKVEKINPASAPKVGIEYIDIGSLDQDEKRIASSTSLLGENAPSRARQLLKAGDQCGGMAG